MNLIESYLNEVQGKSGITFPKREWTSIRKRLDSGKTVITIRVYKEYDKYHKGDVLSTEWNSHIVVTDIKKITDIKDYEHYNELDNTMLKEIGKTKKIDIVYFKKADSPKRFFHISTEDFDGKIMKPRTPSNYFIRHGYENGTIPRISFAPDVNHSFLSLGYNIIKDAPSPIFNVYEPDDYSKLTIISNEDLIKRKLVPDAYITKELWVTSKCKLKYVGKVRVVGAKSKHEIFTFKGGKFDGQKVKQYYWTYKVLEGDIK